MAYTDVLSVGQLHIKGLAEPSYKADIMRLSVAADETKLLYADTATGIGTIR